MAGTIDVTRDGPLATIWLDREARYNAITVELMTSLIAAAGEVSEDDRVRAVIIRGRGRHFSVGADLKAPGQRQTLQARRRATETGGRLMRALQEIRQPTICALNGAANGGGACIASACDFRIAADSARVGYGEVRLGMPLMWGALPLCVRLVGPARAKRLVMSGTMVDAPTLADWGFVDEVVPEADLAAHATAWAEEYAALPPLAVQMIKRSVNAISGAMDAAVMHMDADQFLLATRTEDYREGVAAFLEKRPPVFNGD